MIRFDILTTRFFSILLPFLCGESNNFTRDPDFSFAFLRWEAIQHDRFLLSATNLRVVFQLHVSRIEDIGSYRTLALRY